MRISLIAGMLAALCSSVVGSAGAQTAYPARAITLIVPFAAGGPTDVVARILGEHMSRTLGQQLVVEHWRCTAGRRPRARAASEAG